MPFYRVASLPFPYGKRRLAMGEIFEADERLGRIFVVQGRATAADTDVPTPVDLPEEVMTRASKREPITEEVEAKPAAPLYKTRHLEAEKPAAAPKKRGRPAGKAKRSQS